MSYLLVLVGYYMYIEATGASVNETAEIMSPAYPGASQGHCFSFWYHMYGADVGSLNVLQKYGNKKSILWGMKGNRGNVWKKTQITITNNAASYEVCETEFARVNGEKSSSICWRTLKSSPPNYIHFFARKTGINVNEDQFDVLINVNF